MSDLPPARTARQSGLWLKVVSILTYIAVFFSLYQLFAQAVQHVGALSYVIFATGILLLHYLVIAAHEIGHLLAGKLVGFRFRYLVVGPVKIERQNNQFRLSRVSTRSMPGGLASAVPPDDHDLRRRMIIMISGGPLANLLIALLAVGVFLAMQGAQHSLAAVVFLSTCILSATLFALDLLATLTPFLPSRFFSDGRLILELLKKSPHAVRMCASIAIDNASRSGTRPRDWNTGLVQQVTQPADDSLAHLLGLLIAYYHSLDRHEIDEAGCWIDQVGAGLPHTPLAFRANFLLEMAYFEARYRRNSVLAHVYLAQATEGVQIDQATRVRAESAVHLAEGFIAKAHLAALQGLTLLEQVDDLGLRQVEGDWLQDIADKAQLMQSGVEPSYVKVDL